MALFENLKLLTSISLDKFKTKRKNRVPDFLLFAECVYERNYMNSRAVVELINKVIFLVNTVLEL